MKKYTKNILFGFWNLIYIIKKNTIMRTKTKEMMSISIDKKLTELIKENITNKSKYIEWLIYRDMKKNNADSIDKIII